MNLALKVIIINVRGSSDVRDLVTWSVDNKYDFLFLTEAGNKVSECTSIECYHSLVGRGVAIFKINNKIVSKCPHATNNHVVVKLEGDALMIHLWYVPPASNRDNNHSVEIEEQVISLLSKSKRRTIHVGDFNARTRKLGDKKSNGRGNLFYESLKRGSYEIINSFGIPTFEGSGGKKSIIDWTIVSQDLVPRIKWSCSPPIFGSDHESIELSLSSKVKLRHDCKKEVISPAQFLRMICQRTKEREEGAWFQHFMQSVASAKRFSRRRNQRVLPEHLQFIEHQIDLLRKKIRSGKYVDETARCVLAELMKIQKEESREARMMNQLGELRKGDFNHCIKRVKQDSRGNGKFVNVCVGGQILTGNDACRAILDEFFDQGKRSHSYVPVDLAPDDDPITAIEVEEALRLCEGNSAPGKSGVSYYLLRQWFAKDREYLTGLFSDWYKRAVFPGELKESILIAIKKNRDGGSVLDNARPICMSESIGRWYERIVDNRLMFYLESRNSLSEDQFAYREHRSVESAQKKIQEIRVKHKKDIQMMVKTDVVSAFAQLDQQAIIQSLAAKQIPGNIVRIIIEYLRDRIIWISLGEDWISRTVNNGIPQGSALGPHLYICATDQILMNLKKRAQKRNTFCRGIVSFSDDIVLIVAGREYKKIESDAIQLLNQMNADLAEIGLSLNSKKTQFMVSKRVKIDSVKWNAQEYVPVEQMKIFGLNYSVNYRFSGHVDHLCNETRIWLSKNQYLLKGGRKTDLKRRKDMIMMFLYQRLLLGAPTWYDSMLKGDKKKLETITRLTGLAITGSCKRTSLMAASLLSKMMPFHLLAKGRAERFAVREGSRANTIDVERRLRKVDTDHPSRWKHRQILCKTLNNEDEVKLLDVDILIYTDGCLINSEGKKKVGAAMIKMMRETAGVDGVVSVKKFKLGEEITSYQAEVMAIETALDDTLEEESGWQVAILSDCLSAIKAMSNPIAKNDVIYRCQKKIDQIEGKGIRLLIQHVKGHVGISGNEKADCAAKEAAFDGVFTVRKLAPSVFDRRIARKLMQENDEWFAASQYGSTVKMFFDGPSDPMLARVSFNWMTIPIYSGQGANLSSIEHLIAGNDANCRCGKKQTTVHLLFHCDRLKEVNLRYARAIGISTTEFYEPWEKLRKNEKIHKYIERRAGELFEYLKIENKIEEEMTRIVPKLRDLKISM